MTRKGDFVLRQLEQTGDAASGEEIAERLGKAYDVPAEEVQEDVSAVLKTFRNCGILE